MVVFEALTWEARDVDEEYIVSIFGRTIKGDSMSVSTAFQTILFCETRQKYQTIQCFV
jgi:DNA polymerase delta subunit 1